MERNLFDIPIYWCDEASFESKYNKKRESLGEERRRGLEQHGLPFKPEYVNLYDRGLVERSMMPWRYNQIVGWIRIHRFGKDQLRGEYSLIKVKRYGPQIKKRPFFPRGKAFELLPLERDTNIEIFNKMIRKLRGFEENALKGRRATRYCIVDLESFDNLGRFVNWRRLMRS